MVHQKRVAFGPGQHVGTSGVGPPSFAGGEIVQAGPGRNRSRGGALVVGAAVIEVPPQVRRRIAVLVEVGGESQVIELPEFGISRSPVERNREGVFAIGSFRLTPTLDFGEKPPNLSTFFFRRGRFGY